MKVIQISDFHLYADPQEHYRGIDAEGRLRAVLARVAAERPALVIASGDLTQDGLGGGYRRLREVLLELDCPVLCVPGNHDDPATMAQRLAGGPIHFMHPWRDGGWQVLPLDSCVPREVGGRLAESELARLDRWLEASPELNTLVVVHHPPVAVGSRWMDELGLENGAALIAALRGRRRVKGVLFGHVHQAFEGQAGGVPLFGVPATSVQFLPGADEFALDERPPGYRRLILGPGGSLETEVVWLDGRG
ncbi:phosphodiesterase [Endothiovibrio diazotrophicus]